MDAKFKEMYFNNLVSLARKDGVICEKEMGILLKIGEREKIDASTMKTSIRGAKHLTFLKPSSTKEKMYILNGYLEIIAADGKITDSEEKACLELCKEMELDLNYFKSLISELSVAVINE